MIHEDQDITIDTRATRTPDFNNGLALLQTFRMQLPPGEGED